MFSNEYNTELAAVRNDVCENPVFKRIFQIFICNLARKIR
jgi:hypothetical protein